MSFKTAPQSSSKREDAMNHVAEANDEDVSEDL
jgi:hypothetical protein